ncbi:MAG: gluconeogenesis factor YvcK family protein [Patescibacteria group bacterium]
MKKDEPRIVCLGGGIGTVQILRGLRQYSHFLTVVVSMADDGGSAGRLRRLYSIPPPGDLINCLAALSNAEPILQKLLTYRFKGARWGRDDSLGGQKLGSLIMVAMSHLTGSFETALTEIQRIFRSHGVILPATRENVSIWAETIEGKTIRGEVNIDLGRYPGKREIKSVHLEPSRNSSPEEVKNALLAADYIIAGPGDLFTTVLPVLMVKDIHMAVKKSSAKRIFVVNIANKPFETPKYTVADYVAAIDRHLGFFPFTHILVNNNQKPVIPAKFRYNYVPVDRAALKKYNIEVVSGNVVDEAFPVYHDSQKTAKLIMHI